MDETHRSRCHKWRGGFHDGGPSVTVDKHTAEVHFDSPQSSITPGQGAVFYRDEEVLGGGFISPEN